MEKGELTPDARARRPLVAGTPVEISGHLWQLAEYIPELGFAWDEVHDEAEWNGQYQAETIRRAAMHLLFENYDLTPDETARLVMSANIVALKDAVEVATGRGHSHPGGQYHTYSEWVEISLLANGLDPKAIHGSRLRGVLNLLVATGRTVPSNTFVSAEKAGKERAGWLSVANSVRTGPPA